jgi:hypothetical protein
LVNNACSCAKHVKAFLVRRVVPELVHDVQVTHAPSATMPDICAAFLRVKRVTGK